MYEVFFDVGGVCFGFGEFFCGVDLELCGFFVDVVGGDEFVELGECDVDFLFFCCGDVGEFCVFVVFFG